MHITPPYHLQSRYTITVKLFVKKEEGKGEEEEVWVFGSTIVMQRGIRVCACKLKN